MNRRLAYLLSSALTAVCGLAMAAGPISPRTYEIGVCAYYFITGLNYSAFSAFVLEIVGGQEGAAASTRYTLFTAAANGAIAYVNWLDGRGYAKWGPRGLLVVDAALNLGGIVVLLALLQLLGRRRAAQPPAAAA